MNQKHNQHQNRRGIFLQPGRWLGGLGIFLLVLSLTGCVRFSSSPQKANVSSLQLSGNAPTGPVALTVVQAQIMRFADTYAATIAQARRSST